MLREQDDDQLSTVPKKRMDGFVFSILTVQKYLKLEIEIQVSSILFRDLLTFSDQKI